MAAKGKAVLRILSSTREGMHSEHLGSRRLGEGTCDPWALEQDMCLGRVSGPRWKELRKVHECSSSDAFHPKALCHFGAKSLTRPLQPPRNLRHEDRRSCLPSPSPVSGAENKDKEIRAQAV